MIQTYPSWDASKCWWVIKELMCVMQHEAEAESNTSSDVTRSGLSVPSGALPPHVSLSLAVHSLVQLLLVVSDRVQIAQVPHTQREAQQTHGHHRLILQRTETCVTNTAEMQSDQGLKTTLTTVSTTFSTFVPRAFIFI